jgi:hypothetical protein
MTIVLTKDVRVGGSVLSSGSTQTLAADVEADLVTRGAATSTGLPPGVSQTLSNHVAEHAEMGWGMVVSASAPSDADGRPNGTIWVQTA